MQAPRHGLQSLKRTSPTACGRTTIVPRVRNSLRPTFSATWPTEQDNTTTLNQLWHPRPYERKLIIQQACKPSMDDNAQTCRLLALPPELRNSIYEFTFALDSERDLFTANCRLATAAALLHTCHQIQTEATSIYEEACDRSLKSTHFVIDIGSDQERAQVRGRRGFKVPSHLTNAIQNLRNDFVKKVTSLTIRAGPGDTLVFDDGVWHGRELMAYVPALPAVPDGHVMPCTVAEIRVHSGPWINSAPANCASYTNLNDRDEVERIKQEIGWVGLSKEEINKMVRWCHYYDR